ncbi:hypothetical protein K0M31_017434 [Melipona bicolor]|uniref:Uncharacterized protein n=1 Tax=Melipona bicolor TaxID=60889 RepID=A0AA40KSN7_9HYME|nr:hypothetical protein K0M31_017434 [Melipona bicolor]
MEMPGTRKSRQIQESITQPEQLARGRKLRNSSWGKRKDISDTAEYRLKRRPTKGRTSLFVILSDYTVLRHLNLEIHEGGFFQWSGKKYNRPTCGPARNHSPEIARVSEGKEEIGDLSPNFPHEGSLPPPPPAPSCHFSSVKALFHAIRPLDNDRNVPRWKINREIHALGCRPLPAAGGSRYEAKASKVPKQYGRMNEAGDERRAELKRTDKAPG